MILYTARTIDTSVLVRLQENGIDVEFGDGFTPAADLYEMVMSADLILLENPSDMITGFVAGLAAAFGKSTVVFESDPEDPPIELDGFQFFESLDEAVGALIDSQSKDL